MSESQTTSHWLKLRRWAGRLWPWVLVVATGFYLYWTVSPPIDLEPTRTVSDFEAPTLDGELFRLSAHRGKILVVNVWATWCPPCRIEIPGFVELQDRFRDDGVLFVGLNVDDEGLEAIRSFVEEHDVNYPQMDGRRVAYRYFPGETIPRTYLIDQQGRIRFEHTGFLMKGTLKDGIEALLVESGS